jgi:hypothetical protein
VTPEELPDAPISIAQLSRLTGIPIATIRSWERRYDIVRPLRTPGGHRRYGPREVARMATFADAVAAGRIPPRTAAEVFRALDR